MRIRQLVVILTIIHNLLAEDVLKIRRLEKRISDVSPFVRVCFDRPEWILKNSGDYILQISRNNTTQADVISSTSNYNETCQNFVVDIDYYEGPTTFQLAFHSLEQDGEYSVLAKGFATVTLKGSINFTSVWIGGKTEKNFPDSSPLESIRLQHDFTPNMWTKLKARMAWQRDGTSYNCRKSPCYMIEVGVPAKNDDDGQVLLCVSNVGRDDTKGCEVCEVRVPNDVVGGFGSELQAPNEITMTYNIMGKTYLTVTGNFDDAVRSLETVFHRTGDTTYHLVPTFCNDSLTLSTKSCVSSTFKELHGKYEVIMVALDVHGKVFLSTISRFENFETKIHQHTSDLIEVDWNSADEGLFEISLDKEIPNSYHNISVYCGGVENQNCSVYFTRVGPAIYEATVRKIMGGTQNLVASSIETKKDKREHIKVFSVVLDARDRENATTSIKVCIEDTVESYHFQLALIDHWGKTLRLSGTLSGSDILCLPELILDPSFDTSYRVRILVTSKFLFSSFAGDSELYLLDPNKPNDNVFLQTDQVAKKVIRTKWLNLNDAQMSIGDISISLSGMLLPSLSRTRCNYNEICGIISHFKSHTPTFQVTEFGETMQIVFLKARLKDVPSIRISSHFIGGERQVETCFKPVQGASRYELSLGVDSILREDVEDSKITPSSDGKVCLLSTESIEVGPFTILEIIVTAYDSLGKLLAAEKAPLNVNFVASSKSILVASTMNGIIASWHRLKDLHGIHEYRIALKSLKESAARSIQENIVAEPYWYYQFLIEEDGDYVICMRALSEVPKAFNGEVCSDIIHFHRHQASQLPLVEALQLRITSMESVFLTWEYPAKEEVSSFVVTWQLELRNDDNQSKDRLYIFPPELNAREEFGIIPKSKSSFLVLDLEEENYYLFCVAIVEDNLMGNKTCRMIDLRNYHSLDPPENLEYKNKMVTWDGLPESSCRVEWISESGENEGYAEVQGINAYNLILDPGVWAIAVRNVTDEVASRASTIHVSVEGIVISSRQTAKSSLSVTWYENRKMPLITTSSALLRYEVMSSGSGRSMRSPSVIECSGEKKGGCSFEVKGLGESYDYPVSLKVLGLTSNRSAQDVFRMHRVPAITKLSTEVINSDYGKITWNKVEEAKRYRYTLYTSSSLKQIRLSGYQPHNSLDLQIPDIEGNVLLVQCCTDEDHCGDTRSTTFEDSSGNGVIIICVSSAVGLALLITLINLLFRKRKRSHNPGTENKTPKQQFVNMGFQDE